MPDDLERVLRTQAPAALTLALVLSLSLIGCGWMEKTVQCTKMTRLSNQWSDRADLFGRDLEARMEKQLGGLDEVDYESRPSLVQAAQNMHTASDTLDSRVESFFADFTDGFQELELTDPQLVSYRERYIERIDDVTAGVHQVSAGVRHLGTLFYDVYPSLMTTERQLLRIEQQMNDAVQRLDAAEAKLEDSTEAEERLLAEINAYCHPLRPPRDAIGG